ncbi:hypothetical protein ACIQUB_08265 [Rhizobium sp. NPDC090275]|uniref:hypothetical protein n=1 Tax=Rhizobium sp. NPDC090275 TaxID=3364498 RepID=UPI00383B14E5
MQLQDNINPARQSIAAPLLAEDAMVDQISLAVSMLQVAAAALVGPHDVAVSASKVIAGVQDGLEAIERQITEDSETDSGIEAVLGRLRAVSDRITRLGPEPDAPIFEEYDKLLYQFVGFPCRTQNAASFKASVILGDSNLRDALLETRDGELLDEFLGALVQGKRNA